MTYQKCDINLLGERERERERYHTYFVVFSLRDSSSWLGMTLLMVMMLLLLEMGCPLLLKLGVLFHIVSDPSLCLTHGQLFFVEGFGFLTRCNHL